MKKQGVLVVSLASMVILSGCGKGAEVKPDDQTKIVMVQEVPAAVPEVKEPVVSAPIEEKLPVETSPELMKISGIGYGAESTFAAYTPGQRRLMAIRSSKLDAYRALAEQLYGIKIDSNTSVSTMTAKNDSFRARVNAVVRGARVVSVTPMADNNYETVLEVYVDKRFFEEAFVYTASKTRAVEPEAAYKISSY